MTEPYIRPDVRRFLDFLNNHPRPPLGTVPIAQSRALAKDARDLMEPPPRDIAHVRDIACEGPAGTIPMRCYDNRTERGPSPVIHFIHGGGYALFDIDHYDPVVREFAFHTGLPVVSTGYRLAPEHPFPAAPDDCEAAARFVASSPDALPFDVTGLALSGDSAGGNLAIVTALALRDEPAGAPVIALAPIYPAVSDRDRTGSMQTFAEGYSLDRVSMLYFTKSYAAPLGEPRHHLMDRDLSGLPPSLVMTASLDPLHDQGVAFVEKLRAAGVPVEHQEAEGNIHGLITRRKVCPSSQGDVETFLAALKQLMEKAR